MNLLLFILIMLCAVASAFFSGTESGILSTSHARLMHLVRSGSKTAALLNKLMSDMAHVLTTLLVGNNIVNVMLSTLSASLAARLFPTSPAAQTGWAFCMAFLMLYFCEFLPKMFFTTRPLRRTLFVIRVFYAVERTLSPLIRVINAFMRFVLPRTGRRDNARFRMTRDYIRTMVADQEHGARISDFERLMIERVFALHTQSAREIMKPLNRVRKVREHESLATCFALARQSGHSRLPVFDKSGTVCLGVLNLLDVLQRNADPAGRAGDFVQPPLFVDDTFCADDVLPLMRKRHQSIVLVRQRGHERVLGIITENSILRALTDLLVTDPSQQNVTA